MLTSTRLRRYLQGSRIVSGPMAGEPFRVLPWEGKLLKLFDGDGDLGCSVGRGNGKSAVLGAICAAHTDPGSGLATPGADVLIVAASLAQARVVFGDALAFLRQRHDLDKKASWRVNDSLQFSEARHLPTGTKLVALGSNPKTAHGRRPALTVLDEPAQWEAGKRDKMIAALRTARGKVKGSRLVWIGTRSAEPGHPFEQVLSGPRAIVYAADTDADPWRAPTWHAANPSMRFMPELRAAIAEEARDAKQDPAIEASFRALRLNQGVSDTAEDVLLSAGLWERAEKRKALPKGRPVVGLDLATTEMAAAFAVYPSGRAEALGFFPRVPNLKERGRRDHVGDLYLRMAGRGELLTAGDHVLDVSEILDQVVSKWGVPACLAIDRWRAAEVREALGGRHVPLVERGMGYMDGGEDTRRFRRAVAGGFLAPVPSLLVRSALANARTMTDPAGNVKLARHGPRRKDDAAAAAILAAGEADRRRQAPPSRFRSAVVRAS